MTAADFPPPCLTAGSRSSGLVLAALGALLLAYVVQVWQLDAPAMPDSPQEDDAKRSTLRVAARTGRAMLAQAIAAYGDNSISAYALDRDKIGLVWDQVGSVAYRQCAGVALAVGEPIAPQESRLALAAQFMRYCRGHGWIPAFYQVLHQQIGAYQALGLCALKIGEEAIVELPTFSLEGKRIANVRHCVTHVERAGLRAEIYPSGVADEATLDSLTAISNSWLTARGGRGEIGFSMGNFSRTAMRMAYVALARDRQDRVRAFVTFRHVQDGRGVVLDLLRRDSSVPSGTIDFLLARSLEHCRDAGLAFASLSLAPLANVAGDGRHPVAEQVLALLYEHGSRIYRYKSLYRFKRKFGPRWEPRYLLYPAGNWNLVRVALAMALVHRPHGLLSLPIHPLRDLASQRRSRCGEPRRSVADREVGGVLA